MPSQSKPSWSTNFASSAATIARFRLFEMRSYGTHWYRSAAFGIFARSSSMRYAMNEVSPTGWSRHHRMCPANHRLTATTSSATRQTERATRSSAGRADCGDAISAPGRSSENTGAVCGPHAAPEEEALGGLLDQHADAVGGARDALRLAPSAGTASSRRRRSCRTRTRPARNKPVGHSQPVSPFSPALVALITTSKCARQSAGCDRRRSGRGPRTAPPARRPWRWCDWRS